MFRGPLRNAVHRLKYVGDMALGDTLSRPLIGMYKRLEWKVDLVVPVPMGVVRKAERGYNQAALLAWPLAVGCGVRYRPQAIVKIREIPSQVGLSVGQRYQNVHGAYRAQKELVTGKSILIVDDVTTSGATMHACATALVEAGAHKVYGMTLARAARPDVTADDPERMI